jgi:A/G-specific adenine glycosylase
MNKGTTLYQEDIAKLHTWYALNGRHTLPWRETRDAYKIWVSEIMLQQTQVKTVLERYYSPFLTKFPTLQALANASIDEVLKAWEGLGYYSRARNLHQSAQRCQTNLPKTAKELEQLAGIGKSSAHAIACFAYGEALPILDANVKRILYRYFAVKKATPKELWAYSYKLFDKDNAYAFNQAMMDIGALICTPTKPQCHFCPLERGCQGRVEPCLYPTKKPKKQKPIKTPYIVVYQKGTKFALFKNDKRLLSGLWGFQQNETKPKQSQHIGEVTHHYSHFALKCKVLLSFDAIEHTAWFSLEEIDNLALSGVDRKVLGLITKQ